MIRKVLTPSAPVPGSFDAVLADTALADAARTPFWLDDPARPGPRPRLTRPVSADLAIVGGGFSGLWTALLAKERHPEWDVVLAEGGRIGWAATGRNGGFCAATLTHGDRNGQRLFPDEFEELRALGRDNLDQIEQTIAAHQIACDFDRAGALVVATEPHQVGWLKEEPGELLGEDAVRAEVNSPAFLAGRYDRQDTALLNPAALAWGLARVAEAAGVRILEQTPVLGIGRNGSRLALVTPYATITARKAALGTNAFRSLVRRIRLHTVPVYDHVLVTEPLSASQRDSIGWRNRQGLSDLTNQFHYFRLTPDNRILWGGYDAIYHYGRHIKSRYDQRPATTRILASHFFQTFPQLEGLRFTHQWGGAIDTCTRFCAFFGTAHHGDVSYALGYTGLGVGASRFGAQVMLDLLDGEPTPRTSLRMVRSRPLPFPPEPLAYAGIQITRRSLARADSRQGERNLWLRTLDRFGVGYDS
jgi:glycine/D-amino acid oxidase-like deaminating enzyme